MGSIGEEHKFGFNASGHAYRVLSATLYSDKVFAAVRETVNNARDAHIQADNANPFLIHLPSLDQPFWAVRDFGPGLSHTDMTTIYSTYFLSTKARHSKKFAGQLGLGTKAPLAYSDSFTVTSYFGGQKSVYTIFFNEDDEPALSPPEVSPSSEPTGLEVRIDVDASDIREFVDKTETALAFFDPMPTIVNGEIDPSPEPILAKGSTFDLTEGKHGAMAVMGVIPYPIDITKIPGLTPTQIGILKLPLYIHVPLGLLDFVPSREGLSYDKEKTIPNLKRIVREVEAELLDVVSSLLASATTEFEARRTYSALLKASHKYSDATQLTGGAQWRSLMIKSGTIDLDMKDFPGLRLFTFSPSIRSGSITMDDSDKVKRDASNQFNITTVVQIATTPGVQAFESDRDTLPVATMRAYFRRGDRSYGTPNDAPVYVVHGPEKQRQRFLKRIEGIPLRKVSELKQVRSTRTPVSVREVLSLTAREFLARDYCRVVTVDFEAGGLFIGTKSGSYDHPRIYDAKLRDALRAAQKAGVFNFDEERLFAVPASLVKKFRQADHWEDAYVAVRHRAVEKVNATDFTQRARFAAISEVGIPYEERYQIEAVSRLLPAEHPMRVFLASLVIDETVKQEIERVTDMAHAFEIPLPDMIPLKDTPADAWKRLLKRYPMLDLIKTRHYVSDNELPAIYQHIADYIAQVDRLRPVRAPKVRAPRPERTAAERALVSRKTVLWADDEKDAALALKREGTTYREIANILSGRLGRTITKSHIVNLFNRDLKGVA